MDKVKQNKAIADLVEYKEKHKVTDKELAQRIGVCDNMVHKWRHGLSMPTRKSIVKMVKAGVSDVAVRSVRRQQAIEKVLVSIDNKNKVKRKYTRRSVEAPVPVRLAVSRLLDNYITDMGDKKSLTEHMVARDTLVSKLYNICKQGG